MWLIHDTLTGQLRLSLPCPCQSNLLILVSLPSGLVCPGDLRRPLLPCHLGAFSYVAPTAAEI